MKSLYLYLHIPRTGGTSLERSIGHWSDRTNDRYLKHLLYVEGYSEREYERKLIPLLRNRTSEQQKQLRIISGHSVFCNSHKWVRNSREPKIFTVIRNPIERCLSSFNFRHTHEQLMQDPSIFSLRTPIMNENAIYQKKTASDYDTLWEYYQDNYFEQNIQCKWIVKSFLHREGDTWLRHPSYLFGPDSGIQPDRAVPITWPEWMSNQIVEDVDWYKLAENFFKEIWWLTRTENLNDAIPEFCEYAGLDYVGSATEQESLLKYWTIDEVMNQPDIDKLIHALRYDFKLYETAKNWRRPF